MEKAPVPTPLPTPPQTHHLRPFKSILVCLVWSLGLLLLVRTRLLDFFSPAPTLDPGHDALTAASHFDWDTLPTTRHFAYSKCYGGKFECARLELPMDYWNGTTNATISLAVARLPAVVPVTHPQYGGAILLNPGGPGGSGVNFVESVGHHIQSILDTNADSGKFYDIISFDPRGVGLSTPNARCLSSAITEQTWRLRFAEEGLMDASDVALGRTWSMSRATGGGCSILNSQGKPEIKQYISTASVARDMLEIVEQHGVWREAQAKRLLRHGPCPSRYHHNKPSTTVPAHLKYKPGKENIQYWGFSYGTYLGNTFAAMFPDRIDRIVVDGVVDGEDYRKSLWSDNLLDAEKAMDQFYFHCARVGYPACALANSTHKTTPADVKRRTGQILDNLLRNPLPVIMPNPEVISYSDVRLAIFSSLYSPIALFPGLAALLSRVEQGDGKDLAPVFRSLHGVDCSISRDNSFTPDGLMAIACTDGDDISSKNRTEFEHFAKTISRQSPTSGPTWAIHQLQCIHYTVRPFTRFVAPWKAKTSHPLLLIGNTADPVTPGAYARKMAKGFDGAVALLQDSAGHCSISAFSNCTVTYVRQYFQTGTLPPANTTCSVDVLPFGSEKSVLHGADAVEEFAIEKQRHARIAKALARSGRFPMQQMPDSLADSW